MKLIDYVGGVVVGVALLFVMITIILLMPLSAQRIQLPADLSGVYTAVGSTPAGAYTARATIHKHNQVYSIEWLFPQGDGMIGVGFVHGGEFVVGFEGPGVAVYRITNDKPLTLEAQWGGWGMETLNHEQLIKGEQAPIRAAIEVP